jgi:glycosyltransferase involved in cell wall biosynthesis
MKSDPLVSVLINNYNYGRFLGEAIDSALAQTYTNIEVIVVDDGSTDNSREVMASYGGRILPIFKENGGQASAFNAGFAVSAGDIVCFLDSDDFFMPGKVSRIVKVFGENRQAGWCFETLPEFDSNTGVRYPRDLLCTFGQQDMRNRMAAGIAPYLPTATSGLSFRRETLALILPMPERIRITSDGYLKLVAVASTEGWMESEELSLQRIHAGNAYTRRSVGKTYLMGRTGLVIGLSLRERFPHLGRLAINSFSYGLGMCWVAGRFDSECRRLTQLYFRGMPLLTRAEVLIRAAYRGLRHIMSNAVGRLLRFQETRCLRRGRPQPR